MRHLKSKELCTPHFQCTVKTRRTVFLSPSLAVETTFASSFVCSHTLGAWLLQLEHLISVIDRIFCGCHQAGDEPGRQNPSQLVDTWFHVVNTDTAIVRLECKKLNIITGFLALNRNAQQTCLDEKCGPKLRKHKNLYFFMSCPTVQFDQNVKISQLQACESQLKVLSTDKKLKLYLKTAFASTVTTNLSFITGIEDNKCEIYYQPFAG